MASTIASLAGFRFMRRLEQSREKIKEVVSAATKANDTLEGINAQLRKNVENQKVLNKHLASRGDRTVVTPTKPRVKLALVVSNGVALPVIPAVR